MQNAAKDNLYNDVLISTKLFTDLPYDNQTHKDTNNNKLKLGAVLTV